VQDKYSLPSWQSFTNQPTNQPTHQPTSQPTTNQPTNPLTQDLKGARYVPGLLLMVVVVVEL
jgi:hypothetical protein